MTHTDNTESATTHMRGPWIYTLDAKGICGIHQANNATGIPIKIGEVVSHSQKQAEANARLIATAPELLEALDYLLEQTVDQDLQYGIGLSEGEVDARAKALAALAKAAGDYLPAPRKPIVIEVRGGVVQEVLNVPPGYEYEVTDYDNIETDGEAA